MLDRLSVARTTLIGATCSARTLSVLADLSVTSAANFLQGTSTPKSDVVDRLYRIALAVGKISNLGFPIDFSKVEKIKQLVEMLVAGGNIEITITQPPAVKDQLFCIFLGNSYFTKRRRNELGEWQVHSTYSPNNASCFQLEDADKLKVLLTSVGYRPQVVKSKEQEPDFIDDVCSVWGETLEAPIESAEQ